MTGAPVIPILITLSGPFAGLRDHHAELASGIASDIGELLGAVGLAGEPAVEIVEDDQLARPVRIQVHTRVLRFSPYLLWSAVLRAGASDATDGPDGQGGETFPAEWLDRAELDPGVRLAALRTLVTDCIRARPGSLVNADDAASLLDGHREGLPPPQALATIVAHTLDMGVTLDPAIVGETLRAGFAAGRSSADLAEGILRRLRSDLLELHVHPDFAPEVLDGASLAEPRSATDPELGDDATAPFTSLRDKIERRPGMPCPDPVWVPSPNVAVGHIAIKVNDSLGPPVAVPDRAHVVTDENPRQIASRRLRVARTTPALERTISWFAADAAESLDQVGMRSCTGPEFAALVAANEVTTRPGRLFTVAESEQQLAQLSKYYPELVEDVLGQFTFPDLTRILRDLIEGDAPITNLREVLQRLVLFEDRTVDVPPDWTILADLLPAAAEESPFDWKVAHARLGLGDDILADVISPGWPVVVVPIDDPPTTAESEQPAESAVCDALLDRVWAAVRNPRLRGVAPIVVTDVVSRKALQALVAGELPTVSVMAWPELPSGRVIVDMSEKDGPVSALEQTTRSRVADMLAWLFESVAVDDDGDFVVMDDDIRIYVAPEQQGDLSIIQIFSYAVRDVTPSPELYQWLAHGGTSRPFSRVQLLESGDRLHLLVIHELLGNYLDRDELAVALYGVGKAARASAAEIAERFSGPIAQGASPPTGDEPPG